MNDPYVIITTCDRELESVKLADGPEAAVSLCNRLLQDHCETIGYGPHCDAFMAQVKNHPIENNCGGDIRMAVKNSLNAWCNFGDMAWDAYASKLPEQSS